MSAYSPSPLFEGWGWGQDQKFQAFNHMVVSPGNQFPSLGDLGRGALQKSLQ